MAIKYGIIGCGVISHQHLKALKQIDGIELTGMVK